MHEISVMSAVVRGVLEAAEEAGATRVLSVRLAVGELTHLAEDQLGTAFAALARGTIAEGASLLIEAVEARVSCSACGFEGPPPGASLGGSRHLPVIVCPECNGLAEIIAGRECLVAGVEAEVPEGFNADERS